jgi:hypothetical protein
MRIAIIGTGGIGGPYGASLAEAGADVTFVARGAHLAADPQSGLPPTAFSDDLTNLANAFTRRGLVKHLWNPYGWKGRPSGPTLPGAETELIPSGTLEPTTASWQAEPVETEPLVGLHRLVPFRRSRDLSGN